MAKFGLDPGVIWVGSWVIWVGSRGDLGWEGSQEVPSPSSWWEQGQLWGQTRLLVAPSSICLSTHPASQLSPSISHIILSQPGAVTAFNVQNPSLLPTHRSALFSSLIPPCFANVIPADAAAPAGGDFISLCNQVRAKQVFFKHHFRDGEEKCSGQIQTRRSRRFGVELHLTPSRVISSIPMSLGMQEKSPTWEAGKGPKAKSGLEGLGRAAEPEGQGSLLTFPRSFPNSHQLKCRRWFKAHVWPHHGRLWDGTHTLREEHPAPSCSRGHLSAEQTRSWVLRRLPKTRLLLEDAKSHPPGGYLPSFGSPKAPGR